MRIHIVLILLAFAAIFSTQAIAQPTIAANGVRNSASYALPGLPNYGIAQGAIFVVFGQNLGPAKIVQVSSYPLPTSEGLSGTSIQVSVNGTSVYAIMLYTLQSQVAAVLPSDTPIGVGTITVTYNGQTSNTAPITVVPSSFGIFAVNQSGSGAGVLQNVNSATDRPFNTPTVSAHAGQVIILWGTGLGPVSGNEAAGPLPGDMPKLNVHVYVGGVDAAIQYRGRSGCCTGDDQIVFVVPAGVEGCGVPVYVQVDNVVSNFVTMSIGASGSQCQDSNTLSAGLLAIATKNGALRIGTLSAQRVIGENAKGTSRSDNLGATFESTPLADFQDSISPSLGFCNVTQFPSGAPYPPLPTGLDAGDLSTVSPAGSFDVPAAPSQKGTYVLNFEPAVTVSEPNVINDGTLLKPGTITYTFTGGADVGPGTGSFDFPLTFKWTNDSSLTSVNRSQPLTVTWTGGTKGAMVTVHIQSQSSVGVGAELACSADATLGTMTISAAVLSALPPSYVNANGTPQGSFSIVEDWTGGNFSAQGLDMGTLEFNDGVDKSPILIH